MSDGPAAIRFARFRLAFPGIGGDYTLLENVDLEVPAGSFYLLVGESGSGKSTLLSMLTGLWEPRVPPPHTSGRIEVLGHRLGEGYPSELRQQVQAVLQDEGLLDELSPRENVELALKTSGRSERLALAVLARAGMERPPDHVADLSGGQRKRVAVARALVGDPALMIYDEPSAGLDAESGKEIAELIRRGHDESKARTTIVITHDLPAFRSIADGILVLDPEQRTVRLEAPQDFGTRAPRAPQRPEGSGGRQPRVLQRFLLEVAAISRTAIETLSRLPPLYPQMAVRQWGRYILDSALFVVAGSAVIGGLATYFSLRNNPLQGAFVSAVIAGCGKVLISVLVPMLAGLFFTARISAGAAARIGTMKRSSQVRALELMGIRPSDYLLTPMVWGMTLGLPIATFAGMVSASMASYGATVLVTGTTEHGWASAYFRDIVRRDFLYGLIKAMTSGFLIASATYHIAIGPMRSGQDVGEAVNRAIVFGIFLVLIVHSLGTLLQFP